MVLSGREVNQVQNERLGVNCCCFPPSSLLRFPDGGQSSSQHFSGEDLGPSPPERYRLKQKQSASQLCPSGVLKALWVGSWGGNIISEGGILQKIIFALPPTDLNRLSSRETDGKLASKWPRDLLGGVKSYGMSLCG